ncbi:MAG: pteridine reductase [Betaproteobacteria bacterium]|nr:pteridine reductase [Betaproteobacteria bacterium]
MEMQDRVIIVTGAARRVGAAIVRELHAGGARVMLHYRSAERDARSVAAACNAARAGSAQLVQADLLDPASPRRIVEATLERFGRLDGLVNNASSFLATPLGAIDTAAWDDIVGTNLRAPLFLAQEAAPHLRAARGALVNIIDIHAERPLRDFPLYCAAKAGLLGLTRALAIELAPEVRVNAVAPGPIQWPEDGSFDLPAQEAIIDHTLLKRCGEPLDVARAVRFLMAGAPYVTGQVLAVDGGRSVHL